MTSLKMELLGLGASFHVNRLFGTSETKKSYQQNYQNKLKTDVDSGGKQTGEARFYCKNEFCHFNMSQLSCALIHSLSAHFKNTSAIHLTQLQDTEASGAVRLRRAGRCVPFQNRGKNIHSMLHTLLPPQQTSSKRVCMITPLSLTG